MGALDRDSDPFTLGSRANREWCETTEKWESGELGRSEEFVAVSMCGSLAINALLPPPTRWQLLMGRVRGWFNR